MTEPPDTTLSVHTSHKEESTKKVPLLFVAFEGARPTALSARYSLEALEAVTIGRGTERKATFGRADGKKTLTLTIPDPRMSSRHAHVERELGRWILADAGSKNGTIVDGTPVDRVGLGDGALIEMGHTLLVFRHQFLPPGNPDLFDAGDPGERATLPGLLTVKPDLADEFARLSRIAGSGACVLIRGESGTGKELVARAVHALSERKGSFVAVNCGAIPESLVESELFGARKGAFSGASEDRIGLVRSAHNGTFFLDEIADLPLSSQAAFLRVLQEKEVTALGETEPTKVDFGLAAATSRDLDELISVEAFRGDLYARISGFELALPPLRDRREDLGVLCATLLRRIHGANASKFQFALDAVRALYRYHWPMNIRELEKCLVTATALAEDGVIEVRHLPQPVQQAATRSLESAELDLTEEEEARREELLALLREHRGNVSAVARAAGKARMQVQRWIKRYNIDPARFR